jgi:hypothetical protein
MPLSPRWSSRNSSSCRAAVVLGHHRVADIGPVEGADELARVFQRQALDDLAPCRRVRGGGQRDPRDLRPAFVQQRELAVLGAEIVAPIATRSAPRRWRTARSGCARAATGSAGSAGVRGRRRAGRARHRPIAVRPASPPAHPGWSSGTRHARRAGAALRPGPASTRSAARPRCRCPRATARAVGSTATCRHRSASAPGRHRLRSAVRRSRPVRRGNGRGRRRGGVRQGRWTACA